MSSKLSESLPGYYGKPKASHWRRTAFVGLLSLLGAVLLLSNSGFKEQLPTCSTIINAIDETARTWTRPHEPESLCPLVKKVDPKSVLYNNDTLDKILHDETFRNHSLNLLWDAIKIPTQGYDDQVPIKGDESLEDLYKVEPRWKPFEKFVKFLPKAFPLVYEHLDVETINNFGLIYTWKGSTDKKPLLLTAHLDVVPIQEDTLDQWTYPPFEGGYDGKLLYGRGVADCKNLLIGLLETVELLLKEDKFEPERTIILGFGYDEELAGNGAKAISKHLNSKYGRDSFYALIDEGNAGFTDLDENVKIILPATGEKGHIDSFIELYTPGGHSSIPPKHTLIGLLSKLISKIEDTEFESIITKSNPTLNELQCVAEYSSNIDKDLKSNILKAHLDANANKKVLEYLSKDLALKFLVTTSQAVDIVQGGVKANALPEHVSVLVNHRIAVEDSVASTRDKIVKQILEFAEEYELGVVVDGKEIKPKTKHGHFSYTTTSAFEPAPLTPINDEVWETFGGSLRYLYEELLFPENKDTFVVAPYLSTGNTDTRSYWDLTRNIYRYLPGLGEFDGIHSVNERLDFDAHLLVIAFYYFYLQVVDQVADTL